MVLPDVIAGECTYGTLKAWFSKDCIIWENATVHIAKIKHGEPFYIKAESTTKINVKAMSLELWETGEENPKSSSFELLEGPECFFHFLPIYQIPKNTISTYIWKFRVKQNTTWAGTAPLNIQVNYNKNDYDDDAIYFTVVNVEIQKEIWEKKVTNPIIDPHRIQSTSGFELFFILVGICIVIFIHRKHS